MITSSRKRLLLAGGFALIGILLIFATSRLLTSKVVKAPESNFIPSDAPATITNSEKLFVELEPSQFEQLRIDLTNYSRNYKKNTGEFITYKFDGFKSKDDSTLVFLVKTEDEPKHSIEITLGKLPQQRVNLSFVDPMNGSKDFDSSLISNSKRNLFIATLPYDGDNYSVEYNQKTDKFTLFLYERSNEALLEAKKFVENKLAPQEITDDGFEIIAPGRFEDPPLERETIEGD